MRMSTGSAGFSPVSYNGDVRTTADGLSVLPSPTEAPAILPSRNGTAFGFGASLGIAILVPFVATGGFILALWMSAGISALAFLPRCSCSLFLQPQSD